MSPCALGLKHEIKTLVAQRIMVKATLRSDHPWSAIFCVIVYCYKVSLVDWRSLLNSPGPRKRRNLSAVSPWHGTWLFLLNRKSFIFLPYYGVSHKKYGIDKNFNSDKLITLIHSFLDSLDLVDL